MVVQVISKRMCDMPGCSELAQLARLQIEAERWTIDLCAVHRAPLLALPWTQEHRGKPVEDRAKARRLARYDSRVRNLP